MKQRGTLLNRIADRVALTAQPMPGVPLVEIAGDRRVLIENHLGVKEYETDRICVAVKFGRLYLEGSGLEISMMSVQQLVVTGTIRSVTLERGSR